MAHDRRVLLRHGGHGLDVGLRHYQKVGGRLGGDVIERIAQIVLVDLLAGDLPGDDLAE